MFADDIKIYSATQPTSSSAPEIQRAIDELVLWSETWQLNLALSKCFVCPIHRRRNDKGFEIPRYRIGTYELEPTEQARDLGVLIDKNLNFKKHIENIIHSASVKLRLIKLCLLSKDPYLMKKAFTTYVRPLLEYCSPVWSPRHKYLIDGLEKVQKRFTRMVPNISHLPYSTRLSFLGLKTLEERRLIADLCFCYRSLNGMVDYSLVGQFKRANYEKTRGHSYKLMPGQYRTDDARFFITGRVVSAWNSLPQDVVGSSNYSRFRSLINQMDLSKFSRL